jgi:tetratricopeptide (TPR) repeat protein
MPSPFLSSEEYDERAHQLYNEGNYDDALSTLREGLGLYPNATELHVGVGYARVARDEFAWARRSFEEALVLDPDHEDALAGLGETLLKFGQTSGALKSFHRILELGYQDDIELMLQVGRALFRDGLMEEAKEYFDTAIQQVPEYVEARIYLGNVLYDRGEYEAALYHLDRTGPDDHWDELGIWRLIELKKSTYRLADDDPALRAWDDRLNELAGEPDTIDEMLAEIEQAVNGDAELEAKGQLELFGALLVDLSEQKQEEALHQVTGRDGRHYEGSWEDIVAQMRDASATPAKSVLEFMQSEARRGLSLTGILISTADAESFIRGSADAGLLRILG